MDAPNTTRTYSYLPLSEYVRMDWAKQQFVWHIPDRKEHENDEPDNYRHPNGLAPMSMVSAKRKDSEPEDDPQDEQYGQDAVANDDADRTIQFLIFLDRFQLVNVALFPYLIRFENERQVQRHHGQQEK